MRFKQNGQYKVVKSGASLHGLPQPNGYQEKVALNVGDSITYVGDEYAGVGYDVVQPPYFRYLGKDYVFQPSSFSGLIPEGYLEFEA